MCRSLKLWIALGAAAIVVLIAAPNSAGILPFLLVAACPLSMLVMMGGMAGMARGRHDTHTNGPERDADEVARLRAEVAEWRERADR